MEYIIKNKHVFGIIIVVVALLGFFIWSNISSEPILPEVEEEDTDLLLDVPAINRGVEDRSQGSVNAKTPAAPFISYADALIKYKDARIQLDALCQASPNNVTFKNGTTIMIDNRSSATRSVKAGSTFNIKAYGFKLVELSSPTLPATWLVDCDRAQNVATILIQK